MPQDNVAVRIGKYRLSKTLGMGSFSRVKLAHHEITGMKVAIKILDRNKIRSLDMDEKVRREIKILRELKHPHIVRLFEVIETPTEIFLVLEYVSNGELFDFIVMQGRVPEDLARRLFQQIISGVAFCHHHKIVHRDLKPENLLLSSDYTIKVADFGLSNIMLDGEFLRTSCGSPNYAAPEVIVGDLYAGPEVDVWSSGVILYALLCGSLPFDDEESIPRLFRKIKNGVYTLPAHLSEGARDLIPRMLMVDPINRITMDQIREHSWFKVRLPPYLQVSPCYQETVQEEEVDQEVLESIIAMDYPLFRDTPRHVFLTALTCEKTNVVRVTYDMLLDKKKNDERVEQTRLAAEAPNSRNPGGSGGVVIPGTGRAGNGSNVPASSAPTVRPIIGSVPSNSYGGYSGAPDSGSNHASPGSASTLPYGSLPLNSGQNLAFPGPRPHRPSRGSSHIRGRRWYLGIQSKKEPVHVMVEVFLALGNLACQWQYKSSHPYRLVCRWKPSRLGLVAPGSSGDQWVYLGLQLYKIQSNKDMGIYLLDFQRVGGISSAFQFMNLCSCIIHALKQPSHSRTNYSRHHRRPSASRSHRSTAPSPQQ